MKFQTSKILSLPIKLFDFTSIWGATGNIYYVIAVILLCVVLLYKEVFNAAIIFLLATALLLVAGILNTQDILQAFANEQVMVIIMLLIVGKFLKRSPIIETLFQKTLMNSETYLGFKTKMLGIVALLSGFMNNTPLVALLMPYVSEWGREKNISPSKLLMPLSYAAIMGGGLTLIGTSTNLIVNSILVKTHGEEAGLGMFSFTLVGAPLVIIGVVYLLLFSKKWLPDNKGILANFNANTREYLVDLRVSSTSKLIGKTVGEANLRNLNDLYLVEIVRGEKVISPAGPDEVIKEGDDLIFAGATEKIIDLVNTDLGLEMPGELSSLKTQKEVVEVVIPYNSSLARKKIKDSNFRGNFDAAIIAVRRDGEKLYGKIGEITFKRGDMMLCVAGHDFYKHIGQSNDITLVSNVKQLNDLKGKKSALLIPSVILAILLPALGLVSLFHSLMLLFVVLLVTRTVRFGEVKREVNINLIVIMAGALSLGTGMNKTGAADLIARNGIALLEPLGTIGILGGIYLLTNLLAAYMTNIAAVSIITPIALSFATAQGLSPVPFVLCVAFAGSKNFITPIGYQTNLMVYGPGGYSFKDFFRFGMPLTLVFMVITLVMLDWLYL